jgi:hypothetical protein
VKADWVKKGYIKTQPANPEMYPENLQSEIEKEMNALD